MTDRVAERPEPRARGFESAKRQRLARKALDWTRFTRDLKKVPVRRTPLSALDRSEERQSLPQTRDSACSHGMMGTGRMASRTFQPSPVGG